MKMKKYIFCLCILCCICMISCSSEGTGPAEQYENEEQGDIFCFGSSRMCETEDAYYGISAGNTMYVRFMDKESRISGFLCGKTECEHNDTECNAYVGMDARGFCMSGEQLYWVGDQPSENGMDTAIWSMGLDGNQRKKIKKVSVELLNETAGNSIVSIYQDTMFIAGTGNEVSSGAPRQKAVIKATKLDSSDQWIDILDVSAQGEVELDVKAAYGKLYIMLRLVTEEGIQLDLYQWNFAQNELSLLLTQKDLNDYPANIWVTEEGIYISALSEQTQENDRTAKLYQYVFATGELEKRMEFNDFNYQWVQVTDQVFLMGAWDEDMHMTLWAKDFSGNTVCQKAFAIKDLEDAESYGRIFLGGNREHIFFTLFHEDRRYVVEIPLDDKTQGNVLWEDQIIR